MNTRFETTETTVYLINSDTDEKIRAVRLSEKTNEKAAKAWLNYWLELSTSPEWEQRGDTFVKI